MPLVTEFLPSLGSKHPAGTIHASTIVSNDDSDEREQLKLWFAVALADATHFTFSKPEVDERQATQSRLFSSYINEIQDALPYRVWDIQHATGDTVHIVLEDSNRKRRKLSGRADYIITSPDVESRETALPFARCVVEIQSKPLDEDCEYQLKTYLVIMMNLYPLKSLTGILVYENGTCRAYRARRGGDGGALYEQNDTFLIYQIVDVLRTLLSES